MEKQLEKFLTEIAQIKSPSGSEAEMLIYLEEELRRAGLEVERQPVTENDYNLIAWRGKTRFAVCTHADHVVQNEGTEPQIENGFYIGEGAADTRGQLAALLFALQNTSAPAAVIITVDEEKEGKGSRALKITDDIKGVLVLEPTDFTVCTHQAGAIELKLQLKKEAYHASCSVPDENPVLIACSFLNRLKELREKSEPLHKWNLPVLTPIFIRSGNDELYASPDELLLHLDLAVAPEENATEIFSEVMELARKYGFQVPWAEVEPGFIFPSSSSILRTVEKVYVEVSGKEPQKGIMPSWTDAANIALSGTDTVVFGAGKLAHCHTSREFVRVDDLKKLADFLVRFFEESGLKSG